MQTGFVDISLERRQAVKRRVLSWMPFVSQVLLQISVEKLCVVIIQFMFFFFLKLIQKIKFAHAQMSSEIAYGS